MAAALPCGLRSSHYPSSGRASQQSPTPEPLPSSHTQVLATAGDRKLLSAVNVLAIAYHNAALEHERLGRVREAHVCFTR